MNLFNDTSTDEATKAADIATATKAVDDKAVFKELNDWQQRNEQNIYRIHEQAKKILEERNEKLKQKPEDGKEELTKDQIDYAVNILCDRLIDQYVPQTPVQREIDQARRNAFSIIHEKVQQNLNHLSLETLIAYVFKERINVLTDVLRDELRKKQLRNEQIEALGALKTMLAGLQPDTGEALKKVTIAGSHEEIVKLRVAAKQANFDLASHLDQNMVDKTKITQSYAAYQKLTTALTQETDKNTHLDTSQQLLLTELKKQIDQCWEFMSHFSKRHHDTIQTIISNMR